MSREAEETTPRQIRFPRDVWADLRDYADRTGRPPQEVIRRLLAWFMVQDDAMREEVIQLGRGMEDSH